MADHIAMYRRNGISKLYSFDVEDNIVQRQKFNAPTNKTVCKKHAAADLPSMLDEIADSLSVEHLIIWLDYTGARKRGEQLSEFLAVLQHLSIGDIARLTLDATLPPDKLKANLPDEIAQEHLLAMKALLANEFARFHPEDFELESQNDMPRYLSTCLQHLCDRAAAKDPNGSKSYRPMLQTYYFDSAPMFTVTILVQDNQNNPMAPDGFGYLANDWTDIENLEVPELTAREKSYLDRLLDRDVDGLRKELGYDIARAAPMSRQWASFKKYHRFLPQFQHVEIK